MSRHHAREENPHLDNSVFFQLSSILYFVFCVDHFDSFLHGTVLSDEFESRIAVLTFKPVFDLFGSRFY